MTYLFADKYRGFYLLVIVVITMATVLIVTYRLGSIRVKEENTAVEF